MVRREVVLNYVGKIIVIIGLAMLLNVIWALVYKETTVWQLLIASFITISLGGGLTKTYHHNQSLNYRESFAVVTLGWIAASLVGTLPFLLTGHIPSFADALFETVSGFTTTGASVLADVEAMPYSLLFWRSLTHWLGGMGIIVLFISVIGGMGYGANQLFKAEITGPVSDKISPRIKETARFLWITYVVLTIVLIILLLAAGMGFFDAVCHGFSTVATGGFSTKNQSIAYWDSGAIQWIIILFMFLCGASFALHYQVYSKRTLKQYLVNREFRMYSLLIIIATAIVILGLNLGNGIEHKVREAVFQVVSVITTTGFSTIDYDQWAPMGKGILWLLMLVGGCAGSTAGGIKVIRHLISLQRVGIELKHMLHPRAMISQKFGDKFLDEALVTNVLQFIFLYVFIAGLGTLVMTALGLDLLSSLSASIACLGNVGPGFAAVGPAVNYGFIPDIGKYVLCLLMLLGRLEIYTFILVFIPDYWRE
ncbi:MAG: TrkH family potassium uptake protein [Syntrophomonadaceae bacterium]|nr:TrkH family potassium uptake protein [Bacillota bacterium]NLM89126.1 TrkH family potassium uptake protein [Syntrophomonadaceae bacterium]HAA09881.1 potassium transporter [Syntrophomonas sp.]HQA50736.1 TrkH family potassium uptake protein [Syntrophomonadaceae bacterium]HQD89857.1 TrkH family potassium uptake protein [Syntrophomonadaceae bacterium]